MDVIDLYEDFTFEELLDAAADKVRGKTLTEKEWEHCRDLWAGLGVVLSPCRPQSDTSDDAYDRAMDFLNP